MHEENVSRRTVELVTRDKEFTFKTQEKAHQAGVRALDRFHEVGHQAAAAQSMQVIEDFINDNIEQTGCFGLAQVLIHELSELTDVINESLDETKPLFGKVSPANQAKAETLRAVIMANWLKVAFDELQKRNAQEV